MFKREMNTAADECITTKGQSNRHCERIQLFSIRLLGSGLRLAAGDGSLAASLRTKSLFKEAPQPVRKPAQDTSRTSTSSAGTYGVTLAAARMSLRTRTPFRIRHPRRHFRLGHRQTRWRAVGQYTR